MTSLTYEERCFNAENAVERLLSERNALIAERDALQDQLEWRTQERDDALAALAAQERKL